MTEIEVTFARAARIWWAYTWRSLLAVLSLTAVLTAILTYFGLKYGWDHTQIVKSIRIAVMVLSVPIGVGLLQVVFNKRFKHFRIALLSRD